MVLKLPTWKPIELHTATMILPYSGSVSDCTSRLRWSITDPASMDAPACALSESKESCRVYGHHANSQSSHRCLGHVGQGSIPCSRRLDRGFARDRRHLPDRIREDAAPAAGPHCWLIQARCCPERGLGPSCQQIFAASLSVEPRSLGCARRSPLLLCTAARHATEALWTAPCARRPRGKRKAACACAPWLCVLNTIMWA